MTQADLAAAACVKQQMISKLETGKAGYTGDIVAIANALGVTAEYLQTGMDQPHGPAEAAAPAPAEPDLAALMTAASPRSRAALERIAQAADAGRLTDADMTLLEQIADRLAAGGPDRYAKMRKAADADTPVAAERLPGLPGDPRKSGGGA